MLSETDVAIIFRVSCSAVSNYVLGYEKEHRVVLPRPGTEMDMGKTLTHKKPCIPELQEKTVHHKECQANRPFT